MKFKLYLITLFILTGMLWLWFMLVQKFSPLAVENFPMDNLRFIVIGCLYLLYVAAFFYFAIEPSLRPGGFNRAAFSGGLLGMLGSAGNFWTNLTSRHLPLWLIVVDMVWWVILMGATAAFVVWLGRKWEKELKARDQAPTV